MSPISHGRQAFTSTKTPTSTNTSRVSTSENSATQAYYQTFLDSTGMVGLQEEQVERSIKHLRESARVDYGQRITLESLSPEHYMLFARALSNVLSTEVALLSFAQIIDGLPIADVASDIRGNSLYGDHPLDKHEDLCPGAMDKARDLQKMWILQLSNSTRRHASTHSLYMASMPDHNPLPVIRADILYLVLSTMPARPSLQKCQRRIEVIQCASHRASRCSSPSTCGTGFQYEISPTRRGH